MGQRALQPRHDLVQAAATVGHDPEAPLEPGGEAGVEQFDQVEIVVRHAQHVIDQLPEPIAAIFSWKKVTNHRSPRPFRAVGADAGQILRDIVGGGADGIFARGAFSSW